MNTPLLLATAQMCSARFIDIACILLFVVIAVLALVAGMIVRHTRAVAARFVQRRS